MACLLACPATPPSAERGSGPTPSASTPEPEAASSTSKPEFVLAAESGDVVELVAAAQAEAAAADQVVIVYVGASWCEPCQYFHAAIDEGRFDEDLAGVRFLEFDLDRDRDRLIVAGYRSKMIPLFIAPGPDGRPGPRRTEGGVKGPKTVDHLRERLIPLVAAARADQRALDRG